MEPPTMYATRPIRTSDPRIPRRSRLSAELTAASIPCCGESSARVTPPGSCSGLVPSVRYFAPETRTVRARRPDVTAWPANLGGPAATLPFSSATRVSVVESPELLLRAATERSLSGTPKTSVASGDDDPRSAADRLLRPERQKRRVEPEVGRGRQQAAQRPGVTALERALEARADGERTRPVVGCRELVRVCRVHRAQPRLEADVNASGLAAPGDRVQPPRRGPQRKERDKQEIRDEFDL